ncbi:SusC/RagA family TonB-linked outer membrane protein [Bacteroides oleiciplenus]|uniref:SusC/RagA family TonB-linked outer membrane protein n=2 Tax=Bacteroides oleiciplenus TaxID=626931 RepID=K9E2I6_9BACE|nr:TonB-dependent receptor [Bacteroides oleiciplenus]EKU91284.1 SusC/RagA family TonB-linked outer membrane protein [Bacteroides oleiciplenus YIT 12058]
MVMKNVTKKNQKLPYLLLLLLLSCLPTLAQNGVTVKGTVLDGTGETVIGASIVVKGNTSIGTISDIDGNFTLAVPNDNVTLVISFIGMKAQEVKATAQKPIRVMLEDDSQQLDEVVVVGFGQQKKASVVGAIAQTSSKTLERTGGVTSLGQALTGNLPGVVTMTTTGKPGDEDPKITIRGVTSWNSSEPLVLVDGVERPMASVDINSVASISVLKDASATAVFGVRGANGVILITTKRGEEGKAVININASTTLKTYSKLPDMMDSYDALALRNQVIESELAYHPDSWSYYLSQDRLNKYRYPANQAEAERYPNVDWVDYLLKDVATSYNANVNISGGTKFVKYFASADFAHEGDIYKKVTNTKGYDPGFSYDRINVRSNLDFNLTKTTKLHLNLSGSHAVKKATQGQYENLVWSAFYGISPDSFVPVYSDGTFGYYYPNPTQAATNSYENLSVNGIGYTTDDRLNTDFTLEQDLGFVLKGLNVQAKLAFDNAFRETGRGVDDTTDWEAEAHKWIDPDTGLEYTDITPDALYKFDFKNNNAWKTGAGSVQNNATYRRMNYSVQLNYSNKFGNHTVGGMGNFSREQYATGSEQPHYRENWVFRATYDYASRYMVEYNGAYNGSEIFAKENRFAFFNSGAIGWMVSEEPLVKKLNLKWLDMFKLRASYGQIGDDNVSGRWLYMDTWSNGGSPIGSFRQSLTGVDPAKSPYTWWRQSQLGNKNLQWEVATKLDIAADFAFFGGVISGSFDYFKEKRSDILITGANRAVPSYFGASAPVANLGKVDSEGFELDIRWTKQLGSNWRLWGNASLTHATSKIKEADDPKLKPEYQKKADKSIGQTYSYVDHGYYNSWDELYGSTAHDEYDSGRKPGNYVILDYDADGIISVNDNIPYGFTDTPQNTMNLQVGVDYKGWSFFVQFYGVNNVNRSVGLTSLGGTRNTAFYEGSYWSPSNQNADVPLPRWLNQTSKYTDGTRFLFDGSYTRLKYAELSYTFSKEKWLKTSGLSSLKLFINGNNLFLWTDMPDDRESNTGGWSAYPTQRRFNLGFKITL